MTVHVALLRGINVGGKNRLPMRDVVSMFRDAGCLEPSAYIQSGNVVFEAGEALARRVPGLVSKAIAEEFGFDVPVAMRTLPELRRVVRGNPFKAADADHLHVAFLLERPNRGRIASLDPARSPRDEYVVHGREIYLRCPNGIGRSKLTTQYFDGKLATTSTLRNWRTVTKLLELAGAR